MSPRWLLIGYFVAGIACATAIVLRSGPGARSLSSAAAAVVVWPLWAPFVLFGAEPVGTAQSEVEQRILSALARARAAVASTPFETLLSEHDVRIIQAEVTRIAQRLNAIELELGAGDSGSSRRTRREARLAELRATDRAALEEVAELCELLATELALARYGSGDGVEQLLGELTARVDALTTT